MAESIILKQRGIKMPETIKTPQSTLIIEGGKRIEGEIKVQGAKNSSLPVLAAALLSGETSVIHNCPALSDTFAACRILSSLGAKCRREQSTVVVDSSLAEGFTVSDSLMRQMRSSIVFLGAILGRTGRCRLSFPGGCELGPRPIDIHLDALKKLGVRIIEDHGVLDCTAGARPGRLDLTLSLPSVGATENIILYSALGEGETVIYNAAREPEVSDMAEFLNECGADIRGYGSSTVVINGVKKLHGCEYSVMPDRIAAATYMGAAAVTGGELVLSGVCPKDMYSCMSAFSEMGCGVYPYSDKLFINAKKPLKAIRTLRTMPYPGFPTDCQPIVMAALCRAKGTSMIVENIFENRFMAAPELMRMGADIKAEGRVAVIEGVPKLSGAAVRAADLRAGAALAVAALGADGTTTISNLHFVDRGYESLESVLAKVGADIKRR